MEDQGEDGLFSEATGRQVWEQGLEAQEDIVTNKGDLVRARAGVHTHTIRIREVDAVYGNPRS